MWVADPRRMYPQLTHIERRQVAKWRSTRFKLSTSTATAQQRPLCEQHLPIDHHPQHHHPLPLWETPRPTIWQGGGRWRWDTVGIVRLLNGGAPTVKGVGEGGGWRHRGGYGAGWQRQLVRCKMMRLLDTPETGDTSARGGRQARAGKSGGGTTEATCVATWSSPTGIWRGSDDPDSHKWAPNVGSRSYVARNVSSIHAADPHLTCRRSLLLVDRMPYPGQLLRGDPPTWVAGLGSAISRQLITPAHGKTKSIGAPFRHSATADGEGHLYRSAISPYSSPMRHRLRQICTG